MGHWEADRKFRLALRVIHWERFVLARWQIPEVRGL